MPKAIHNVLDYLIFMIVSKTNIFQYLHRQNSIIVEIISTNLFIPYTIDTFPLITVTNYYVF